MTYDVFVRVGNRGRWALIGVLAVLVLSVCIMPSAQAQVYVDGQAATNGNGASPDAPRNNLPEAIQDANSDGATPTTLFVRPGTYQGALPSISDDVIVRTWAGDMDPPTYDVPGVVSIQSSVRLANTRAEFNAQMEFGSNVTLQGAAHFALMALASADDEAISVIQGNLVAAGGAAATVAISPNRQPSDATSPAHHLSLRGDADFAVSPKVVFGAGARLLFEGSSTQRLTFESDLTLARVAVAKPALTSILTIDAGSGAVLRIADPMHGRAELELRGGALRTNGYLDAGGEATLTVRWGEDTIGLLNPGTAALAYVSASPGDLPRRLRYTGNINVSPGFEFLVLPSGELAIPELEIAMDQPDAAVELGQSVTITQELRLTSGQLAPGGHTVQLANQARLAIGDVSSTYLNTFLTDAVTFPSVAASGGGGLIAGRDGIDLLYVGDENRTIGAEFPPGAPNRIRNVTLATGSAEAVIALPSESTLRMNGSLHVESGTLNLNGSTLELRAINDVDTAVLIEAEGRINDTSGPGTPPDYTAVQGAFSSATQQIRTAMQDGTVQRFGLPEDLVTTLEELRGGSGGQVGTGMLRFVGPDHTEVVIPASSGAATGPRYNLPNLSVEKTDGGTQPQLTLNAADDGEQLTIPRFELEQGRVELSSALSGVEVAGNYMQQDGTFQLARVEGGAEQLFFVAGDVTITGGTFVGAGADIVSLGRFTLGGPGEDRARYNGRDPEFGTYLCTVGDFFVRPDGEASAEQRNQFILGGDGSLGPAVHVVLGNYTFEGTGDRFDDAVWPRSEQGMAGVTIFQGTDTQFVRLRQGDQAEDAFLNRVVLDGTGGLDLQNEVTINADGGLLHLNRGIVDGQGALTLLNADPEFNIGDINDAGIDNDGAVERGGRSSYVATTMQRSVVAGLAAEDMLDRGYFFPMGWIVEDQAFFRPLILQFPAFLDETTLARVTRLDDPAVTFAPFTVPTEQAADTLELNVVGDLFYQLEFDRSPDQPMNLRLVADGMVGVNDVRALRIVQFDCDGNLIGLAGTQTGEDGSAEGVFTDLIRVVPNITQKGIEVGRCQIFGIATDWFVNPINDLADSDLALVQVINDAPGTPELQLFTDGSLQLPDIRYEQATPYRVLPAGERELAFVEPGASEEEAVFATDWTLAKGGTHVAIVEELLGGSYTLLLKEDARLTARNPNQAELLVVHAVPDAPALELRLLDESPAQEPLQTIVERMVFGEFSEYIGLPPMGYNVEVRRADDGTQLGVFRLGLGAFEGQALTVLVTGSMADGDVLLRGFDEEGDLVRSDLITAIEDAEVPDAFSLDGNYPNPFNPSTTIQYDLPTTAEVTIEVIDLLGRPMMNVSAGRVEAGADRTTEVHASHLSSGLYFYRVVARTGSDVAIKSGRMMLVK